MITHARKIDMYPASVPVVVHLSQYDDDFTLEFTMFSSVGEFTVETGTTAKIRGTKKDGNGYSANAAINTTQKKVTVTGNQQMTAIAGRNVYELVLTRNNKVLSTANFILDVEPAAMDANTVESESVIQEIGESVNAYLDEHPEMVYQVDDTLSVTGAAADAKATGDEIADLRSDFEQLEPGLSEEAKEALLACFEHVAWIGTDGQDYYDALETALYTQKPVTKIEVINNSAYGRELALDDNYYAKVNVGLTARCRFDPIRNKGNVINVTDANKYSVACYDLNNNELVDYEIKPEQTVITQQGYPMSSDVAPTYVKSVQASGTYYACAFRKDSGADFTTDEIENAEGTVFVVGKQSDVVSWNGVPGQGDNPKWSDINTIIGISDPAELALAGDFSIKGTKGIMCACPIQDNNTVGRATSLSQVLIGDYDGKTVGLQRYTLSTGRNIAFALFYAYLDNSRQFNGDQVIDTGSNNEFVFGRWNTSSLMLPTDNSITGKRVLLIGFKNNDSNTAFTQAELREIPSLITIS